ncbi:hypothetical protein [Oceanobacter mangrovi]|uniref:hypothetical protein n=1 Tax=Oceanobacter mangrovi TaxID=2862510 RepID=UPI001C8D0728|nr:hypothetical protein [Oceanobacter mangrovi]
MKHWLATAAISTALLTAGCTSLHSVSLTQVPADRSTPVSATGNQYSLLGIAFNNSFVDRATAELQQQCPHGELQGVLTEYDTTLYVLVARRTVKVTGYCVEGAGS